ncbi:MAG: hypothetical protein K8L97_09820 [Anaerolineae bacterium]|nr:hypothetical protein [Anaerolineae bacterium]
MDEDGWRFNQITGPGVRFPQGEATQIYIQYEREYIANALAKAIAQATAYAGFPPAPTWIADEIVMVDRDLRWDFQTLSLRYGYLSAFGKRATTLIEADVPVTYTDADSDQVAETTTITVTTAHPADEIQVFFRVADGAAAAADLRWQIEPLTITQFGSTTTITGPKWLFVHPRAVWAKAYKSTDKTEKFAGNTGDTNSFVQAVDVYRVYADPTTAVELLLNPAQVGATNAVVPATGWIENATMGYFRLYTGEGQTTPQGMPLQARVSYRAGYPLVNGQMESALEAAIIKYANTRMPQMPTLSEAAQRMWSEAREEGEPIAYDAWHPPPFGLSNGGLELWAVVEAIQLKTKGKLSTTRS